MLGSAGVYPLALCTATGNSTSPFHAEPKTCSVLWPNAQLGTTSPYFSERRPIADDSHYLPFRAALAITGSSVACFSLIFASIS